MALKVELNGWRTEETRPQPTGQIQTSLEFHQVTRFVLRVGIMLGELHCSVILRFPGSLRCGQEVREASKQTSVGVFCQIPESGWGRRLAVFSVDKYTKRFITATQAGYNTLHTFLWF